MECADRTELLGHTLQANDVSHARKAGFTLDAALLVVPDPLIDPDTGETNDPACARQSLLTLPPPVVPVAMRESPGSE